MTFIHWLRLTDQSESLDNSFSARLSSHFGKNKPSKPFFGYEIAYAWDNGATMHVSPNRPDMGRLWEFSGGTCDDLGMEAMSIILRWACDHACTSSRIDIAHDFFNNETSVGEIYHDWVAGVSSGNTRKRTKLYADGDQRNEFNLNARSSDIYMRAYDKGLELRLEDFQKGDWTRVEFELKGKMSKAAILERSVMRDTNTGDFLSSLWLGLAYSFLAPATLQKTPFLWGIQPTYLQLPKRVNSTQFWLENQVKSGIVNFALEQGENGNAWLADYLNFVIKSYEYERDNQK